MKKLLVILLILPFLFSCGKDDDDDGEKQNYTSFQVIYHLDIKELPNCIAAYKKDDKYYKIADLGYLYQNVYSKKIVVEDKSIKEIYLFADYNGTRKINDVYPINQNYHNMVVIKADTDFVLIEDKKDQTQYPQ